MEIEKDESEYYEYYDAIDININISKYNEILYKINNFQKEQLETCDIYIYKGDTYGNYQNWYHRPWFHGP